MGGQAQQVTDLPGREMGPSGEFEEAGVKARLP